MIDVKKTTFQVDGMKEKCFIVTDGYTKIRINKYYHFIGHDTLFITQWLNGKFHSSEEWDGDFDSLTKTDAINIAKRFSVYLKRLA